MTKPPTSGRMDFDMDAPVEEIPAAPVVEATAPAKPGKKPKKHYRATPEHKALYHKSTSLQLTKDLYIRFRNCLALEEILGQEALEGMVKMWVKQIENKHAKKESGDGTSDESAVL